jgi:D-alanyl-D-alanine carboxypeptidase/D-alanyl-D-alanine-endopeptidase (penicillin-binding protein 4)
MAMHVNTRLRLILLCLAGIGCTPLLASPTALPPDVKAALRRAHVPKQALSVILAPIGQAPTVSSQARVEVNPASVMKLVTTYAALDLLGDASTWTTRISVHGVLSRGVLRGSVLVRGGGDPKLVVERLQPMMQSLREQGIDRIEGDIVLDRRLWVLTPTDPAQFDGEPLRPYNASPDALLINFKSLVMTFTPEPAAGVARVQVEPPMAGLQADEQVRLSTEPCGDWRGQLQATVHEPERLRFNGSYPASCGERVWPTAYADPASHSARAIAGMWQRVGGQLNGRVRDWQASDVVLDNAQPLSSQSFESLPLREIVRDVNKFSNNVMAQHLLLTLGWRLQPQLAQTDTRQAGREALTQWWRKTFPRLPAPTLDNGSGLSRNERIRPDALLALLQHAASHPAGAALFDSLPVAGVDNLKRNPASGFEGRAFMKTGTLRDVAAVAGYVDGASGQRYVVIGIINHPNANAARPALDALLRWAVQQ